MMYLELGAAESLHSNHLELGKSTNRHHNLVDHDASNSAGRLAERTTHTSLEPASKEDRESITYQLQHTKAFC